MHHGLRSREASIVSAMTTLKMGSKRNVSGFVRHAGIGVALVIGTAACSSNSAQLSDARTSFAIDALVQAVDAPVVVIDGTTAMPDGRTADASTAGSDALVADGAVVALPDAAVVAVPDAGVIDAAVVADAVGTPDARVSVPDASTVAQCTPGTYSQATYTGAGVYGIAVGDFDQQNGPDLVIVPNVGDAVTVLLNSGTGTFPTTVDYHGGSGTGLGVVVADFDQDGWDDFAITLNNPNSLAVFLNAQDGTFGAPTLYAQSGSSSFVTAGDLDGDGYPDLVAANSAALLSVFISNGDGTFEAEQTYAIGPGSENEGTAIADFDQDGWLDVVVGNLDANAIGILLNQGGGVLGTQTNYSGGRPLGVSVGDFNNDGYPDVVSDGWFGDSTADIWLNDGTGDGVLLTSTAYQLPGTPPEPAVADLNGDGNLDFAITSYFNNTISLFYGDGHGGFAQQAPFAVSGAGGPIGLVVDDFNGDGTLDLVVENANNGTTIVMTGCAAP